MASKCGQCLVDAKCLLVHMLLTAFTQCWMMPSLICLLLGTGFSLGAALTKSWIHIECLSGAQVTMGITQACFINTTRTEDGAICRATQDYAGWLYSAEFLIYTAVALTILTTLVTSLFLCTPPTGNISGLTMALAVIAFIPAMLLLLVMMNVVAVESRKATLYTAQHIILRTFHYTCTAVESRRGVRTGLSLAYCGVSAACMICSAVWSSVMSCVMRGHVKREGATPTNEAATKLIWKKGTLRGRVESGQPDVIWNEKFFHNIKPMASPAVSRKNSMFVNDSILNILGQ